MHKLLRDCTFSLPVDGRMGGSCTCSEGCCAGGCRGGGIGGSCDSIISCHMGLGPWGSCRGTSVSGGSTRICICSSQAGLGTSIAAFGGSEGSGCGSACNAGGSSSGSWPAGSGLPGAAGAGGKEGLAGNSCSTAAGAGAGSCGGGSSSLTGGLSFSNDRQNIRSPAAKQAISNGLWRIYRSCYSNVSGRSSRVAALYLAIRRNLPHSRSV